MFSGARAIVGSKVAPPQHADHAHEALLLLDALAFFNGGETERARRCIDKLRNSGNLAELVDWICPGFSQQRDRRAQRIRRTVLNPQNQQIVPAARIAVHALLPSSARRPTVGLTLKQKTVLRFVREGLSNQQIAERMQISLNTVKWHLKNLSRTLGVKKRYAVLRVAEGRGLL